MNTKEQLIKAKAIRAPFITYISTDCQATIASISSTLSPAPVYLMTIAGGLKACNDRAVTGMNDILATTITNEYGEQVKGQLSPIAMSDPLTCIQNFVQKCGDSSVLIISGAHRVIGDAKVQQEMVDNRGNLTEKGAMIILLSSEAVVLPSDIAGDIVALSEELPDSSARASIISELVAENDLLPLEKDAMETSLKATRGMTSFSVGQNVALCLSRKGVNLQDLWKLWEANINGVRGLQVEKDILSPNDIGGLSGMKEFGSRLAVGNDAPTAYIICDEFDKVQAGQGDSNGTTAEINNYFLSAMQDNGWGGNINYGVSGAGKTEIAKVWGAYGNVPTIRLDLLSLKGGIVGQTSEYCRKIFSVIKALCGSNAYFIATCNRDEMISPELKRRFTFGTWFFDLPNKVECDAIEAVWSAKFPNVKGDRPDFFLNACVGADIKTTFVIAHRLNVSPLEAFKWVTPVGKLNGEVIEKMRNNAHGRYLSASYNGTYQKPVAEMQKLGVSGSRKINL